MDSSSERETAQARASQLRARQIPHLHRITVSVWVGINKILISNEVAFSFLLHYFFKLRVGCRRMSGHTEWIFAGGFPLPRSPKLQHLGADIWILLDRSE